MAWITGAGPILPGENGVDFTEAEQRTPTCAIGSPPPPIFQQTFDIQPLPNNALKTVAHGIATLDQVVDLRTSAAQRSGPTFYIPIPRVPKGNIQGVRLSLEVDATNLRIASENNYSAYTTAFISMSYTKTDGLGCGGQPVSYFETEQTLGINWVDGQPVFQRTYDVSSSLPDDECVELAHGIDPLVSLVEVWGIVRQASPRLYRPIPFSAASGVLGDSADNFALQVTPTTILLASNADYSGFTGFVTMRYTKS